MRVQLFDMAFDPFLHALARNGPGRHRRGGDCRRGGWCGLRQRRGGQRQQPDDGCRGEITRPDCLHRIVPLFEIIRDLEGRYRARAGRLAPWTSGSVAVINGRRRVVIDRRHPVIDRQRGRRVIPVRSDRGTDATIGISPPSPDAATPLPPAWARRGTHGRAVAGLSALERIAPSPILKRNIGSPEGSAAVVLPRSRLRLDSQPNVFFQDLDVVRALEDIRVWNPAAA